MRFSSLGLLLLSVVLALGSARPALAQNNHAPKPSKVGLLVVDLQMLFVAQASSNPATAEAVRVTEHLLTVSQSTGSRVFVTYESSNHGDHAMPASVQAALPKWHQTFIKTKYAATALPSLRDELERVGLTHVVLMGAETDVCVLLTALGLRELGYDVLLVADAVFSSEENIDPALERLRQAGVRIGDHREAERLIQGVDRPEFSSEPPRNLIIEPVQESAKTVALIVSGVLSPDVQEMCGVSARIQRFRELLIFADWLRLPVYVSGDVRDHVDWTGDVLGFSQFGDGLDRTMVRPLDSLDASAYRYLVLAGAHTDLPSKLAQIGAPRRLFAITDATFSPALDVSAETGAAGFVPMTYKTFYREVTGSVSLTDWPSTAWSQRLGHYQTLLRDPESLPPVELCSASVAR